MINIILTSFLPFFNTIRPSLLGIINSLETFAFKVSYCGKLHESVCRYGCWSWPWDLCWPENVSLWNNLKCCLSMPLSVTHYFNYGHLIRCLLSGSACWNQAKNLCATTFAKRNRDESWAEVWQNGTLPTYLRWVEAERRPLAPFIPFCLLLFLFSSSLPLSECLSHTYYVSDAALRTNI